MSYIDPKISIGNILTSVSILIGLTTFLYNEYEKRIQIDRSFEAQIQDQIGRGLNESSRLNSELKLFFWAAEPLYIAASKVALSRETSSPENGIENARDLLWKGITSARVDMERRILEKPSLLGELAIVGPKAQKKYRALRESHEQLRLEAFIALAESTQSALNSSASSADFTAEVGNAIRHAHFSVRKIYLEQSQEMHEVFVKGLVD